MSMNITPHIPQVTVNSAAPATEALTRDNLVKEVVPAPVATEGAVPQKSREQDSRPPAALNPTYDNIQQEQNKDAEIIPEQEDAEQESQDSEQNAERGEQQDPEVTSESDDQQDDTTSDDAGRAEQQQEIAEREQIRELRARDAEVRAHEQAHAAIGGSYAGAPSYQYQTGPDGRKYAVGGEVSIDVSKTSDPEQTIRKMQTVRAAALAPAEPSSQDRKVALEATQNIAEARAEMIQDVAIQSQQTGKVEVGAEETDSDASQSELTSSSSVNTERTEQSHPDKMSLAGATDNSNAENKTAQVIFNRYHSSYQTVQEGFTAVA